MIYILTYDTYSLSLEGTPEVGARVDSTSFWFSPRIDEREDQVMRTFAGRDLSTPWNDIQTLIPGVICRRMHCKAKSSQR